MNIKELKDIIDKLVVDEPDMKVMLRSYHDDELYVEATGAFVTDMVPSVPGGYRSWDETDDVKSRVWVLWLTHHGS